MPAKKIKESRTNYTTQESASKRAKGRGYVVATARPKTRSQAKPNAARHKRSVVVSGADEGHDEINQNLLELKTGLIDIQQRLSALEEHLSSLSAAQKRFETISASLADETGWLKLSESAFAFWNNAEDDVYDTL